jgi:hypothetical protein
MLRGGWGSYDTTAPGIWIRLPVKLKPPIYLPFVVSLSNHEQKMSSPTTAFIHPSTSSGRTEAVVEKWDVIFAVRLSSFPCGARTRKKSVLFYTCINEVKNEHKRTH